MKKFGRRSMAMVLALALAAGIGQTAYASWALGEERVERTVPLAGGTSLTTQSLWSASRSDLRTEHYITYDPAGGVKPVVFSGNYVASTNTVSTAAAQLEGQGSRVVAAVNGGWFNTDGTIVGMLVTDGVVRSLDVENYALLGFTNDGQVFIDESTVSKKVSWALEDGSEFTAALAGFNAYRHSSYQDQLFLYDQEFSSRVMSSGDVGNVSAILRPLDGGGLRLNGALALEVVSVTDTTQEGVEFNGSIPEGCYMMYAEERGDNAWLLNGLRGLAEGQQVTVSLGGVSEQWADAAYGLSSLYPLLREGEIVPNLPASDNPYTAVGIKADGTAVFYTIDGRQSGYSVGAAYSQVAQRLQELGCVSAVALDGGGSTTLGATLPGSTSFSVVNSPSGGAERRVNNTILLVTDDPNATGMAPGAYVTAPTQVVLVGADLPVSAQPYDAAGLPAADRVPVWSADGGLVRETGEGAVYSSIVPGTFSVSADPDGVGAMPVRVVDELSRLTVSREGSSARLESLTIGPGEEVDLSASGIWWNHRVAMDDEDVTWTVDPAVGTIDASGRFTAGQDNAQGTITATAGGQTVTIPVTVDRGDPFVDMAGHWSADYVTRLYQLGLTSGYEQADGSFLFKPDGRLTRGELLTFITRLLGVDPAEYEDVVLPFADLDAIPSWVLPYVKAMYALGVFEGSGSGGQLYADVGSNVTREAAMTMLDRVLAASESYDLSGFGDAGQVSGWAQPHVETLVALGIVEGSGGLLSPQAAITRGAAAKLLVEVDDLDKAELSLREGLVRLEEPGDGETGADTPPVEPQPGVDIDGPFVKPTQPEELPTQPKPDAPFDPSFDPFEWSVFD